MLRPYISVVIPAYNEAACLQHCLTSLQAQAHTRPYEIIVVDNGSSDDTAAIASGLNVTVIHEPVKGVCAARQAGFEAAHGQIIVSADADCIYPTGWLASIEQHFIKQPDISLLLGTYRFMDARPLNRLLAAWEQLSIRLHYAYGWQVYVSAANLAFRKDLFDGYDLALGSGGDELYVVRQLRQRGRIAFTLDNPILTSARRLNGRFFEAFFKDFGIHYAAAYYLPHFRNNHRPSLRDIRQGDTRPASWPFALAGAVLVVCAVLGAVLLIWFIIFMLLSLPMRPLTYVGLGALATGGLAYCTFWPTSQLVIAAPYRARSNQKIVALTFDDGPNDPYTTHIANIIESYGGQASFFQCGAMVQRDPSITKRLAAAGHTIGNHTYDHSFWKLWRSKHLLVDIRRTNDILHHASTQPIRFFRSPWLTKTPAVARAVKKAGLMPVAGRFISLREVLQPDGTTMARRCLKKITPGAIIILHDSRETHGGDRTHTVKAVEVLCKALADDGYRFVSLDELY